MRRAAKLAHPLRNALITGLVGSVAAEVVASSGMTTVMELVAATRTAVGMEAVDTEEVRTLKYYLFFDNFKLESWNFQVNIFFLNA